MATFLTTTQITAAIEQLVKNAEKYICLVSPYFNIHNLLQDWLDEKSQQIPISIIYGKSENKALENKFKESNNYTILFNNDLHGKVYLSDKCAIVTSMNLYEYSLVNNIEYGILIEKDSDVEIYKNIVKEIEFLKKRNSTILIHQSISEDTSSFDENSPYTMRNLREELKKIIFNSKDINYLDEKTLYEAISKYAMSKRKFAVNELYQDRSCVYSYVTIEEKLYNEIKEYILANKKMIFKRTHF